MSVINPRNRLVNFRLSEVEFEKLKAACLEQGARSISEFARTSVLRSLEQQPGPADGGAGQVKELDKKVAELEIRVEQLLRLLAAAGSATLERAITITSPPAN